MPKIALRKKILFRIKSLRFEFYLTYTLPQALHYPYCFFVQFHLNFSHQISQCVSKAKKAITHSPNGLSRL